MKKIIEGNINEDEQFIIDYKDGEYTMEPDYTVDAEGVEELDNGEEAEFEVLSDEQPPDPKTGF